MGQLTNLELVEETREAAKALLDKDITLTQYPELQTRIKKLQRKLKNG